MSWQIRISQALAQRRINDNLRTRYPLLRGNGRYVWYEGQRLLNFSGNDYLGLSQHPEVIAAWQEGACRYGVGSGGSGHVTGYTRVHQQLEEALASWQGYPRALLFISGFAANQAIITALMKKNDDIVADKLSHASLLEAAMQSPARLRRFAHNDIESLRERLHIKSSGLRLVITEGIFSMDGDCAPLAPIASITKADGAWLLVDDAHGAGVQGEEGRGSSFVQGVKPDLLVITFGKAFGVSGAAVLCNDETADYLLQFARHLIYSTAMPPAQACAIHAALLLVRQADDRRAHLQQLITCFRQTMACLPLQLSRSSTAIQPLIMGENTRTVALSTAMRRHGFWISAIRPPTVPVGAARLRITLTAQHTLDDVCALTEALFDAYS